MGAENNKDLSPPNQVEVVEKVDDLPTRSRPTPIARERVFDFGELFFSTTDKRGTILFGNDVFLHLSGYPKEQVVGAPHNIIRHPDMPKVVFKLLWQTIQANNVIAAYVKNLAIDGSFYWVLAVVFPVQEKYLSVRLKPSTAYLRAAESIYKLVLLEEQTNGVEASGKLLMKLLLDAGFESYEKFFVTALKAEMGARDKALEQEPATEKSPLLNSYLKQTVEQISNQSRLATETNHILFKQIDGLFSSNSILLANTSDLLDQFLEFQILSLNMQVCSAKIGQEGAALAVIAEDTHRLVITIQEHLQKLSQDANVLNGLILNLTQKIFSLKLVVDMVDFFVHESIGKMAQMQVASELGFQDLDENADLFKILTSELTKDFIDIKAQSLLSVNHFVRANKEIRKFVNGIELVGQIGSAEAARLTSTEVEFRHYIDSMIKFSEILRASASRISGATKTLSENLKIIDAGIIQSQKCIEKIFASTALLKNTA